MALIVEVGPGISPPLLHSRSWLKTSRQTQTLLRKFKRKRVPAPHKAPADQQIIWGGWKVILNRLYTKLIMTWWWTDNVPNGRAWWDALAAGNPVTDYRGALVTLTGKRFFLWYQRQALSMEGYFFEPYDPAPVGLPLAPTLPWAPEPAPTVYDTEKLYDIYIRWKTSLYPLGVYFGMGYWSPTPDPMQSSLLPQHENSNAETYQVTGEPYTYGILNTTRLFPRLKHAQHIKLAFALFNVVTNTPTPFTWFDFIWE
jgi:hypothetical protein